MMKEAPLLALPEGMEIDQIQIKETGLSISVISTHPQSCCPLCSEPSSHIHRHYHRTLKDAPCVGRQLELAREPFANSFAGIWPVRGMRVYRAHSRLGRAVGAHDDQAEASKSAPLAWRLVARGEFD
jgi:hypothetical protein